MIRQLSIRNYALIDSLDIDMSDGLTILTGETGAGKSVMMGAISLLMGERADTKVLANRTGKAIVEGTFATDSNALRELLESNDLDWNDGQIIVRREISLTGRSRAFVNDSPVTLPMLTEIAGGMVDIHSQNSNRLLSQADYQLKIIDSLADNTDILAAYKDNYTKFANLRRRINGLRDTIEKNRENRELRSFQLEQLAKINPKKGELEEVEKSFDILSSADELRSALSQAAWNISAADDSALNMIGNAASSLDSIDISLIDSAGGNSEGNLLQRLKDVYIELKDIGESIYRLASSMESDPTRLAKVESRMRILYETMKQFKMKDYDHLMEFYNSLRNSSADGNEKMEELNELESEAKRIVEQLKADADQLSKSRTEAVAKFEQLLMKTAVPLGLKNLQFKASLTQGKFTPEGKDTVEFLCSFNRNQPLMPIAQTASGGEMARLTLSIKAITANKLRLPTVIFDEIDTGVSGDIADRMGSMMAQIAEGMQVFAITHLPQVAVKGRHHLLVYKQDEGERTVSNVKILAEEDRVREIARMLSGKSINEAALSNARELLKG